MAQPTNTQFAVAVHLLTLLAGAAPGEWQDSRSLAGSPATNPAHVRRVLGHLRTAGLVRSQPGPHGGWTLDRGPEAIDLAQVWHAVHGDDPVLGVHTPQPDCPVGQLVHRNLLAVDRQVLDALTTRLAATTVADVLTEQGALAAP